MSILGLPRRSVPSPATHDQVVLNALYSPMYFILALLRKHFSVFAAPLTRITGGSRASSSNLPSRPVCFELTDRSDFPTWSGETPRFLTECSLDRLWAGEVEEDDRPRRRPPPLPPLAPLPPRAPLDPVVSARTRDRLLVVVVEEEVDGDRDLRLLPPLLEVLLDRDLVDTRRTPVLASDGDLDRVVADRVVGVWDRVWDRDWDRDRDLEDRCLDLDRFCFACGLLVLLEGLRPYFLPLVSVCCGCSDVVSCLVVESTVAVVVVEVLEEAFVSACPPGDPGGVELVTGAKTVSLLTFTSHCPV